MAEYCMYMHYPDTVIKVIIITPISCIPLVYTVY